MKRPTATFRLHPLLIEQLEIQAEGLETTKAFILEKILAETFGHNLPPGFSAGMRMPNNKEEEEENEN